MPTNDIKALAVAGGANVLTQAEFNALAATIIANGLTSGVVDSKTLNKILRQSSFIAAAVAQLISDRTGLDVLDDGDAAGLLVKLKNATNFGSMQGATFLNAATVLTADAVGKMQVVGGGTSYAVTLPLIANVPNGAIMSFVVTGQGTKTIQCQGANQIDPGGVTITSYALGQGDTLTLISNGAYWNPVNGSAALKTAGNFAASLGTPAGYQRLPSGLIMQWSTVDTVEGGTWVTWTFPIAFPSAVAATLGTSAANMTGGVECIEFGTTSLGAVQVLSVGSSNQVVGSRVKLLAIGY